MQAWFAGQLPDGWFEGPPDVTFDNDEVIVVGTLPRPPDGGTDAEADSIDRFREETREQRVRIAEAAQTRLARKVSWGVKCGGTVRIFTTASVPVMTRLRMKERAVLDILIDAGVARSRSEALAWCVRLVGRNEADWIVELRKAFHHVEAVRAHGPRSTRDRPEA
jgi:xanthine/CO dehydrogenase XdhC/CoxF family maturation factor